MAKINWRLPHEISIDMNKIVGRGSGAESIEAEVTSVLSLLPNNSDKQIVAFDIGANVGNYTQVLLKSKKILDIYCFEPNLSAYSTLIDRFSKTDRIHTQQIALGKKKSRPSW